MEARSLAYSEKVFDSELYTDDEYLEAEAAAQCSRSDQSKEKYIVRSTINANRLTHGPLVCD